MGSSVCGGVNLLGLWVTVWDVWEASVSLRGWEGMWRFDWAHPESPTLWCPFDHRFCACWEDTGKTPFLGA